jgi:hypothetical protein
MLKCNQKKKIQMNIPKGKEHELDQTKVINPKKLEALAQHQPSQKWQ